MFYMLHHHHHRYTLPAQASQWATRANTRQAALDITHKLLLLLFNACAALSSTSAAAVGCGVWRTSVCSGGWR
jgi:hypothetical protein